MGQVDTWSSEEWDFAGEGGGGIVERMRRVSISPAW